MLFLLKTLGQILKLLNSETSPYQLAAGFCFGSVVGFSPFFTWHNLIIFLVVCLLRVNFSMFFLAIAVTGLIGFFLDPVFDGIGYWMLVDLGSLRSLWITISSMPLLPYFRFNNTVVMGSLTFALASFIPLFVLMIWLIKSYRKRWRERILRSQFMRTFKATKLYGLYQKYESFRSRWEATS